MANIFKIIGLIFLAVIKLVISQVVTIIVIPLALLIWLVNSVLIRNCIRLYLLVRYRGKVKLVSDSGDAMFGYRSNGNTRNILIAIEVDQVPDIKARANQFEQEIIHKKVNNKRPYEKLMWIFTQHLGYFCWKFDENFDIQNHFLVIEKDKTVTQGRLHEILAECRHDMGTEHPQWQFLFIPRFLNADGVETSSIICRFHHGILDGISFVLLVSHCLGVLVPEDAFKNSEPAATQPNHKTFPYILNPLTFSVPLKYRIINNINCVLFGFYHLLKTITSPTNHWKLREKYPGQSKNYDYCDKIDLETLKVIRKTCTVSVPSILSSCFLQALENVVGDRIPERVKLGHSLAFLPYPDEFFHNRFTLMSVSYQRDSTGASRMDKVKAYHRQSNLALQGPEPSLYYWFFQFYGKLPASFFKFPLKKARFSFFLNNLPFSRKPLSIWGSRILDVKGWPPFTTDAGIGVTSVGYCDTVYACATADSSWLTKDELRLAMIEMSKEVSLLASECRRESV